ncbi:MAG: DUF1844 domain-containing protein [Pyrinomonadaceae bacterium]
MLTGDENQQEVTFKVADKRKFNSDGSVKEGVTLESAPAAAPAPTPPLEDKAASTNVDAEDLQGIGRLDETEDEIPGADEPASFVNFLSTIATNAAAALGAVPHPATGKRSLDLATGKYWLDVLGMIREKTKGNLHPQETQLMDGLLSDLRMQYIHLVRATEEKLKAQAAQKFSGADILGKK